MSLKLITPCWNALRHVSPRTGIEVRCRPPGQERALTLHFSGLLDLFLDIVGALGVPQTGTDAHFETHAPRLVASLLEVSLCGLYTCQISDALTHVLQRVPGPASPKDSDHATVMASNAATVIIAELASVPAALGVSSGGDSVRSQALPCLRRLTLVYPVTDCGRI